MKLQDLVRKKPSEDRIRRLIREASGDEKLDEFANKAELDATRRKGQKAVDRYSGDSMRKLLDDAYDEGNTKEVERLGQSRNKVPLVKAALEGDLDTIIKNARDLNLQGRDALLQILEERGDVKKMFALNEVLGGKYLTKDLSKKTSDTQNRIADLMETQAQVNKRFYAPEDMSNVDRVVNPVDDAVAEMSGMSALDRMNMKNPIRERMIADRFKQGQEFVGDFDEVLMNDYLTKEDLMKNPRTQKYLAKEAADLESRAGDGYISSSERKRLAKLSGERDVKKARPYLLEEDASNGKLENDLGWVRREIDQYGPQDILLEEEAELMEQLAESKRLSYNRDSDYVMDQFEDPWVIDKKNPIPMNESMARHNELDYLDKQAAKKDRKYGRKQTKAERRKQIENDIANLSNNGFGRNVNLYRGSKTAKPKKVSDRKILEEMLPSEAAGLEAPDVIEYLTPETRALFAEVNRREKNAAKKVRAMAYPRSKRWSSRDYASFAKGKTPEMRELDRISAEEEVFRELSRNNALSRDFKKKHRDTRKMTVSNKIPAEEGKNVSKWDKPATRPFIVNAAKQNGFRLSEQMIERLLNATKQQVIDYIDNIANPMPSQRKQK